MGVLNFSGFMVLLQIWLDEIVALLKLLNWTTAFAGMTIIWASRDILPESIEHRYIKILGILVCILLSIVAAFGCGSNLAERIVSGLITGCFVIGGGQVLFKFIKDMFASVLGLVVKLRGDNGNGNGKSATPIPPTA